MFPTCACVSVTLCVLFAPRSPGMDSDKLRKHTPVSSVIVFSCTMNALVMQRKLSFQPALAFHMLGPICTINCELLNVASAVPGYERMGLTHQTFPKNSYRAYSYHRDSAVLISTR